MLLILVLAACAAALLAIYYYSTSNFKYWKNRNVPYPKPKPFFGNYKDYILVKKFISEVVDVICDQFPKEPYIGAFLATKPTLIVKDPEYIKLMLTKDFYYFNSREISAHSDSEVTTQNLFFTHGDKWKVLRQNVTPIFSLSKMKKMFYLVEECTQALDKLIESLENQPSVDVRSIMSRYTMDCIGSCIFGVNTKTMALQETQNPFIDIGNKIFDTSKFRGFMLAARVIFPSIFYNLGLQAFPSEIPNFFNKLITMVFEQRKYKNSGKQDFIDHMLSLKTEKYVSGDSISSLKGDAKKISLNVDDELLAAQGMVFFAAGFETSSTTSSFLMLELAKNPDIQERVLEEVDNYFKTHDNLDYDCLTEVPYLEACVNETLRMYPVLGILTREVVEDYKLPTGLLLEKNLRIHIPVRHIHHNPNFFPEPEKFRPERFLGEEKENIKPFTYMPFGEGPRTCIGMRFAKMQITAGMLTLLKRVRIELAHDTKAEIELEPSALTTQPVDGIKLKLMRRLTNC